MSVERRVPIGSAALSKRLGSAALSKRTVRNSRGRRLLLLPLLIALSLLLVFGLGFTASAADDFPPDDLEDATDFSRDDIEPEKTIIFPFDEGKRALVLDFPSREITGMLVDIENKQIINRKLFPSNIFQRLEFSFQSNSLVIGTATDNLELSVVKSDGTIENPLSKTYPSPGFLEHHTLACGNELTFFSEKKDKYFSYINIKNGESTIIDVLKDERFPLRPTTLMPYTSSRIESTNSCPYASLYLKDLTPAFISGGLGSDGNYDVEIGSRGGFQSDIESAAKAKFLGTMNLDPGNFLGVGSSYPNEIFYADIATGVVREKLGTPGPLYQGKITVLNESEDLLLGSTTEDELNGTLTGYIFNKQTRELTDVTTLLANLTYADLDEDNLFFYKDSGSSFIYYGMPGQPGGLMNLASPELVTISADTIASYAAPERESGGDANANGTKGYKGSSGYSGPKQNSSGWGPGMIVTLIGFVIAVFIVVCLMIYRSVSAKTVPQPYPHVPANAAGGRYPPNSFPSNQYGQHTFANPTGPNPASTNTHPFPSSSTTNSSTTGPYIKDSNQSTTPQTAASKFGPESATAALGVTSASTTVVGAMLLNITPVAPIRRGTLMQLSFAHGHTVTDVYAIEAPGFSFQPGTEGDIGFEGAVPQLLGYGVGRPTEEQRVSLSCKISDWAPYPLPLPGVQLASAKASYMYEGHNLSRIFSEFFLPNVTGGDDFNMNLSLPELELLEEVHLDEHGTVSLGTITSVRYEGYTSGIKPKVGATVNIAGADYAIAQTIEPTVGLAVGDQISVIYDAETKLAMIKEYSTSLFDSW